MVFLAIPKSAQVIQVGLMNKTQSFRFTPMSKQEWSKNISHISNSFVKMNDFHLYMKNGKHKFMLGKSI